MKFRFKLALQLGKTVGELMSGIPGPMMALEETHWAAFYRVEPFGDERADLRSAQIAQILFNSKVKKNETRKITDFLPFYRKKVKADPEIDQSIKSVFSKFIKPKE